MAQHDYIIDNQTAPNFRSDLNNALAAIVSTNSGSSAPSTTYANMLWYDTTANILKMRNEADDTWISVGYLDQTAGAFRILDDTQVSTTAGVQAGLLGDQSTATWEAGTGTTESLVSPAKVKAAIDNLVSTSFVLSATAGLTEGGVGTYAILRRTSQPSDLTLGSTYAGSSLRYQTLQARSLSSNFEVQSLAIPANVPSGTWRSLSQVPTTTDSNWAPVGLFVRIS